MGDGGRGRALSRTDSRVGEGAVDPVDVCHGLWGSPRTIGRSSNQGLSDGQEHGARSQVNSWFLCFLAWARQVILSDRGPGNSNATAL